MKVKQMRNILGAGYNGPEEGNMSEYDSSVAYTGTVNNYRANPVFRFKVEARNWLFGDAGSDAQWSVISEQTAILQLWHHHHHLIKK